MLAALAALMLVAAPAVAQEPAAEPLELGAVAPEFSLPGATSEGVLEAPLKLSDFKGKTVVLAFFYKARTGG
jgi:peroxiredoxin